MTDSTPATPEEPGDDGTVELQRQSTATRAELRRLQSELYADADRLRTGLGVILRSTAWVAAGLMFFGLLMKFFIPVSGEDKSLTLFQVLDPEKEPDLLDHSSSWGTGTGWLIPIAMVLICAVLVVSVAAGTSPTTRSGALITVTEVFCWCLSIGCVLGFIVLAGMTNVVGVPAGLLVILLGGTLGIVTARLAKVYRY